MFGLGQKPVAGNGRPDFNPENPAEKFGRLHRPVNVLVVDGGRNLYGEPDLLPLPPGPDNQVGSQQTQPLVRADKPLFLQVIQAAGQLLDGNDPHPAEPRLAEDGGCPLPVVAFEVPALEPAHPDFKPVDPGDKGLKDSFGPGLGFSQAGDGLLEPVNPLFEPVNPLFEAANPLFEAANLGGKLVHGGREGINPGGKAVHGGCQVVNPAAELLQLLLGAGLGLGQFPDEVRQTQQLLGENQPPELGPPLGMGLQQPYKVMKIPNIKRHWPFPTRNSTGIRTTLPVFDTGRPLSAYTQARRR